MKRPQKKVRTILVFSFMSIVFLLLVGLVFLLLHNQASDQQKENYSWMIYEGKVDFVTIDGVLVKANEKYGGITFLPIDYQEKMISYEITTFDFTKNLEKKHVIFTQLPEFTNVRLARNNIDASKLWVLIYRNDQCLTESKNIDLKKATLPKCEIILYEYDLKSDELIEKKTISYFAKRKIHSLDILAHNRIQNSLWVKVTYETLNGESKSKNSNPPALETVFFVFDASTGRDQIVHSSYNVSSTFPYRYKTTADYGNDGELYYIGVCNNAECPTGFFSGLKVARTRYEPNADVPIFFYGQDTEPVSSFQVVVDQDINELYVITKSFDQSKPSAVFRYDIVSGRTYHVGNNPVDKDDDVRGSVGVDGNLIIGSFSGLHIYNKDLDQWVIVNTNNGLKSNNVVGVFKLKNGGLCAIHEGNGASCLFEPAEQYIKYMLTR